jgi:tRNA nucleotidyltransferase (CCA-adding enzyme)
VNGLEMALNEPLRVLLRVTTSIATEQGIALWAVGGCVRDLAAGLDVRDLDLAVDVDAAGLASAVARRVGGVATVETRFGTASVSAGGYRVDLATLRTERYRRPGALPTVRLGATVEDDLGRRDFSVNAIALGLTGARAGQVVDPHGGLPDLEARRLRVLHAKSFIDDATRLWRGARYAARLGLRPEPATARLIEEGARWIAPISGQRLWAEFERTAEERRVLTALRLLENWGVLEATSAGFTLSGASRRALRGRRGPVAPAVLLAATAAPLDADVRGAAVRRLGAPREAARAVDDAVRLLATRTEAPEALEAASTTAQAVRMAARWLEPQRQRELQRALRRWEWTRPHLDGSDLAELGVPAGPAIGVALRRLRRARYLGTLAGVADERRAVRAWLAEERPNDA